MASQSSGSSSGSSFSDPVLPEWSQQLSSTIAALAASMNAWADQQYGYGRGITDQSVQQFLEQSGQAAGFANNLLNQYENTFAPLLDQYAAKAESWSSEARRNFNMGQAESTAGQADKAGMETLKRQLEREGVNTSSGAMAEIMRKSAMDDARNRTMAGTQAGLQTEQQGTQMMQIAAQLGQNIPGMWATAASVRTAALNAMEQAVLGLLNTGVNLKKLPIDAYQAAAQAIKLGQQSRSQQQSQQGSRTVDPTQSGGGGGNNRNQQPQQPHPSSGQGQGQGTKSADPRFADPHNAKMITNPNSRIIPVDDKNKGSDAGQSGMDQEFNPFTNAVDPNQQTAIPDGQGGWIPLDQSRTPADGMDQEFDPFKGAVDPNQQTAIPDLQGGWSPLDQSRTATSGMDQEFNPQGQGPSNVSQQNQSIWDQSSQTPGFDQTGMDQEFNQFGGDSQTPTGMDQQFDPWGGNDVTGSVDNSWQGDTGSVDNSWQGADAGSSDSWQGDTWSDPQSGMDQEFDPNSYQSPDTSYDDPNFDAGYARGGVIPTTGGHVPRSASPSRGKQTDDIPARLNADEFVIPKDVNHHLGSKFFDNLIAKSRKARTGSAGAKPGAERKAPLPTMGRPTFTSRYMGGR